MSGHKIQRHRFDNRRKCEAKSLQCFRLEVFVKSFFKLNISYFFSREKAICSWLQIVKWFLMVSVSVPVIDEKWSFAGWTRQEGFIDDSFFRHFLLHLTIKFREIGWNRIAYVTFNAILRAHKFYFNSLVSGELLETTILQVISSILLCLAVFH